MSRDHVRFESVRVYRSADVPPADDRILDVAVLDMNHGRPNLGHDALVKAVGEIVADLEPLLEETKLGVRALSFDVRTSLMIPEPPGGRLRIYLGTGGPGHIDPNRNDGVSPGAQGIREDASWEAPLFRLFDAIAADPDAVLLAVCHTFGVLCRWTGVARPVLRGPAKGGKSSGVRENVLTAEALDHPWFGRFASDLPDHRRLRIIDSRLFDLIPNSPHFPAGMTPVGYEAGAGGGAGEALTMLELARDRGGAMPRMFAVNHHPEVRDRRTQRSLLEHKLALSEVSPEWFEERRRTLDALEDPVAERMVLLTSQYTLLGPLRYHLYRQVRLRAEALGFATALDEDLVLRSVPVVADPDAGFPS